VKLMAAGSRGARGVQGILLGERCPSVWLKVLVNGVGETRRRRVSVKRRRDVREKRQVSEGRRKPSAGKGSSRGRKGFGRGAGMQCGIR